jgi:hypothetical protein
MALDVQLAPSPPDIVDAGVKRHLTGDVVHVIRDAMSGIAEEGIAGEPPHLAVVAAHHRYGPRLAAALEAQYLQQLGQFLLPEQVSAQAVGQGHGGVDRGVHGLEITGGQFGDPCLFLVTGLFERLDQHAYVAPEHRCVISRFERGGVRNQETVHVTRSGHPLLDVGDLPVAAGD